MNLVHESINTIAVHRLRANQRGFAHLFGAERRRFVYLDALM